ncbi:MAG: SLC13 family permease [bacterium]
MTRLSDYLRPDLAFACPGCTTRQAVLEHVADRLAAHGAVCDREELLSVLLKREEQGSTGVGHGLALPHAITGCANRVLVALFRTDRPVEWGSVDNQPVRLLVVIVAPEAERSRYLSVLAEVARSLNRPETVSAALRARNPEQAANIIARPPHQGFFRRHRRALIFAAAVGAVFLLAHFALRAIVLPDEGIYRELDYVRFNHPPWLVRQHLTITLFLAMVIGSLLFWRFRLAIAAACLGLLLLAGVMDLATTVRFMSIPTILFIMAMMVIVRWLTDIGVFRFVVIKAVERVRGVPWQLLLILMGFSVILGGFADEVSAILVTFGLALEISRRTRAPLVPYLLSLVFATNVGSALTLVGNPIGVYIAFAGRLGFEDFLRWASPVAALAAIAVAGLCLLLYRRHFFGLRYELDLAALHRSTEHVDQGRLRTGLVTFGITIALIALHGRIEHWAGLAEGTALVAVALLATGFIVAYEQERGRQLIERGIDWWTLLFFMFLFANAACLEYTGVTSKLGWFLLRAAQALSPAAAGAEGVTAATAVIMLWFSGLTSGFVDNLPIVAALVPIVRDLIQSGLPHASILWWALLFGGCFGGNLTAIGSTANLVAAGAFERATGSSVRFADWFKVGIIITVVSLLIATAALLLQLRLAA